MGKHTDYTRRWLDHRFSNETPDGVFVAHQPIYGVGHPACEPHHARRMARTLQMLVALSRLDVKSVLDVGGAEGFFASRARDLCGMHAVSADVSVVAAQRAWDLFGIDALALTSHRLPFVDDAFDVVTCSEVIEHVEHPIETLFELSRVARCAVILTTEEFSLSRAALERCLFIRCGYPHHERNLFHPDDLRGVLGDGIEMRSQMLGTPPPDDASVDAIETWIDEATRHEGVHPGAIGVQLVALHDEAVRLDVPRVSRESILRGLMRPACAAEPTPRRPRPEACAGFESVFVCPDCRVRPPDLVCSACGRDFRSEAGRDGVLDAAARTEPTRERTAVMLEAEWPAERAAAALALREALVLPMAAEPWRWNFEDPEQRRGWLAGPDLVELDSETARAIESGWRFESKSATPWIVGPGLGIRGGRIAAIEIEAGLHNPDYPIDSGDGQVFWLVEGMSDFDAEHRVQFRVVNDGARHVYRVDVAAEAAWPQDRDVVCIRIDIVNGPCAVELCRVEIVPA